MDEKTNTSTLPNLTAADPAGAAEQSPAAPVVAEAAPDPATAENGSAVLDAAGVLPPTEAAGVAGPAPGGAEAMPPTAPMPPTSPPTPPVQ